MKLHKPRKIMVTTTSGRGWVWQGTPLKAQLERDAIAVCFDDGKPARYFARSEVEIVRKGKMAG